MSHTCSGSEADSLLRADTGRSLRREKLPWYRHPSWIWMAYPDRPLSRGVWGNRYFIALRRGI